MPDAPHVPIVFLHIPKAAGSTLQAILRRTYRARPTVHFNGAPDEIDIFSSLPEAHRHGVDVVAGHVHVGIHRLLRPGARQLTMLRHPVDRVVSHYHYVLRNPAHVEHRHVAGAGLSLGRYVETTGSRMLDNDQVRWLNETPHQDVPFGAVDRAMLDRARRALDDEIEGVGVAERFDDSLALYRRLFDWPDVPYTRVNVGERRPAADDIDPGVRRAILDRNALDLELYEHALALLDRRSPMAAPTRPG